MEALVDEISPGILSIPLLTDAECKGIISELLPHKWNKAEIKTKEHNVQLDSSIRDANVLSFSEGSEIWELIHERYNERVRPSLKIKWKTDFKRHSAVEIIRYQPGGFYKAHIDSGPQFRDRKVTTVCYLNDDFDEGGTTFPKRGFTFRPQTGHAIMFPSGFVHKGDSVKNGEKFIAVVWSLQ